MARQEQSGNELGAVSTYGGGALRSESSITDERQLRQLGKVGSGGWREGEGGRLRAPGSADAAATKEAGMAVDVA